MAKKTTQATMRQGKFTLDDSPSFAGWTTGATWNGFATPAFEKSEADKVAKFIRSQGDHESIRYIEDEQGDRYVFINSIDIMDGTLEDRTEVFEGFDAKNGKHLFGIGAFAWTWWEVTPADLTDPAREFDTVHDVESFIRS